MPVKYRDGVFAVGELRLGDDPTELGASLRGFSLSLDPERAREPGCQ